MREHLKDAVCAIELGNADRDRAETANLMLGGHRTLIPGTCLANSAVIDKAEALTLWIIEVQGQAAVTLDDTLMTNVATP